MSSRDATDCGLFGLAAFEQIAGQLCMGEQWHARVRSARSFADAQDVVEEAVAAGVDVGELLRAQMELGS